jgi:hypothetical protein
MNKGFFRITAVHRDDLEAIGFEAGKVTDEQMQQLADKMANAYLDSSFWIDLEETAEYLGFPKAEKKTNSLIQCLRFCGVKPRR